MKKKLVLLTAGLVLVVSMNAQQPLPLVVGDDVPSEHMYRFATFYDGNLSVGGSKYINFGLGASLYNSVEFAFNNVGNNSLENRLSIGFYGQPENQRMYFFGNGNLGIGTMTPAVKLTVNGDISVGENNNILSGYGNKLHLLGANHGTDELWLARFNESYNRTSLRINIGDDWGSNDDNFDIGSTYCGDGQWKSLMMVRNNGSVGIGTTDPGSYKLNVWGAIRAHAVVVNTTGADFVFEPTYKLRPLAEVETFINQHKHLPDVAPATEMQTNGVSMGEMQAKLLQKVEELTLYSIEQAKQNAELKQEVEALKLLIIQKLK